jgi:hypothetical protein
LFPTHPIRSTDAAQHAYYTTTLTPPQPVPALSVRERVRRPPLASLPRDHTHRAACVHPPRKNATPSHPPRTHHSLADPRRWLRQLRARAARPFAARAFHRQQHRTGPAAASSAARARQILFRGAARWRRKRPAWRSRRITTGEARGDAAGSSGGGGRGSLCRCGRDGGPEVYMYACMDGVRRRRGRSSHQIPAPLALLLRQFTHCNNEQPVCVFHVQAAHGRV